MGDALADIDGRGTTAHAGFQVSIAHHRHPIHRPHRDTEAAIFTARPSSGIGGPLRESSSRRIDADLDTLDRAALDPLDHPFAQLGNNQGRPHPFQRGSQHRRARKAELQPRLTGIVDVSGSGDPDLAVGDIGLGEQQALLVGIEAQADRDAVEDQRWFASMPPSRIVPPLNPGCQSVMLPFGGSRWASSVMRLAPEMILKGATRPDAPKSHSTLISASGSPSDSRACRCR